MESVLLSTLDGLIYLVTAIKFVLLFLFPLFVISNILSFFIGVPPFPSSKQTLKDICDEIEKYDDKIHDIVDIGSAYGHLALHLARRFPEKKVVGYEVSHIPYIFTVFWNKFFGYKNLSFVHADGFKAIKDEDVKADCALIYLNPEIGVQINTCFDKITTLVVANKFPILKQTYDYKIDIKDWTGTTVYFYKTFLKKKDAA